MRTIYESTRLNPFFLHPYKPFFSPSDPNPFFSSLLLLLLRRIFCSDSDGKVNWEVRTDTDQGAIISAVCWTGTKSWRCSVFVISAMWNGKYDLVISLWMMFSTMSCLLGLQVQLVVCWRSISFSFILLASIECKV